MGGTSRHATVEYLEGRVVNGFRALATDFDGTIAHDGMVDDGTRDALERARHAGLCLLLVTGRELPDLFNTFAHVSLFDRVVAENGALMYTPSNGAVRQLAPAPPVALLNRLLASGVPLSVGASIIATVEPHEHAVLAAIRDLGVEWHVVFNKGSVMVLPSGVTKATGLVPALEDLAVAPEDTIGIGDAENDHAFLSMCGLKVAVSNALPSLKDIADVVTVAARGEGVVELIDGLLAGTLRAVAR
jgi:hydroxymethylpyrimidine pyrophosphatase-like HAD family hydrolase